MSAPIIWILVPILIAPLLWLPSRGQISAILGGLVTLFLALLAMIIPIDTAFRVGELSIKIATSIQILGRSISLSPADQPVLSLIYGLTSLWFFGAHAARIARRLIPLGLTITALLVGSLAVEPFLYAALFIEMAVLLAVPLLSPPEQKPGRGIIYFLIYQTLAMPFILFSGWLLAGVEASPGDLILVAQSATLLGLGFAFLLAIFPLYTWIPLLLQEASPYAVGFILWLLSTITILFGASFLDRYTWLREAPQMSIVLRSVGLLMLVTGGVSAAFQRHLGRMMGYAFISGTGFSLMALSISGEWGVTALFLLAIPQAVGLAMWALALSMFKIHNSTLQFRDFKGYAQQSPVASAGIVLAHLSLAGMPLLASFPAIFSIWEGVAQNSTGAAIWFGLGLAGLLIGAIRTLAVLVMSPEEEGWKWAGSWDQNILLISSIVFLFLIGLFPQWLRPFLFDLPSVFEHLGV